jgi:hypothetical protein
MGTERVRRPVVGEVWVERYGTYLYRVVGAFRPGVSPFPAFVLERDGLAFFCRLLGGDGQGHDGLNSRYFTEGHLVEGDWKAVQFVGRQQRGHWLERGARPLSLGEYLKRGLKDAQTKRAKKETGSWRSMGGRT